ncbi:VanW family protein [Bacillus cereus]|uniref:Vancomycin resistance protein n=1 Tax=Bacillus anthracis TaxID=1392 RepID=A0A2B0Y398_BACAN|nr:MULTISPECIES: VanW family protein [Bacillus]MBJ8061803.1 VanW family protein [Bacillus cereus]MCU5108595.1 VanW family protein [Bacillus cereus]MCU5342470.1 VanW family protein [Bacillus cereus]PFL71494.1 hypothetical protein COJ30_11425 [Bacillus anthracis]
MARKLLTQRFPFLIPIRIGQRRLFKKISDRLKGYKFSKTFEQNPLPYRIYKHKSLLIRKLGDTDIQLQYNKITNLKLAICKINQVVIKPGETFSFWHLVGNSSEKAGYKEGIILMNGEAIKGIGGGLCQLGNLLYWMFLHSELETAERYRHSFDPFPDYGRVIPFGTGATLMNGIIDLKLINNSNISYQVNLHIDDEYIYGEIRASQYPPCTYSIVEEDHRFVKKIDGQVYRQNKVYKKIVDRVTGNLLDIELVMENDCLVKYEVDDEKIVGSL